VIPFSSINDDYCDCPDGSDEPGTSACTYLSSLSPIQPVSGTSSGNSNTTLALPGYYCKNKGHQPGYIPSSYVNDGVCDYDLCCDGSDEWAGVGGVVCEDKCVAMGKEWRKKEEERVKSARASLLKRGELLKQAEQLRAGIQQRIVELESEVVTLQTKEDEARRKLEDVEWSERSKVVKGASEKASKVTVLAKLAKARVEELRNGLTSVIEKRDAANSRVQKLESILEAFKVEYNPNFNDEGVKRAVKAWEDYVAEKDPNSDADVSGFEKDLEEIGKPDSEEQGINWAEWEKEEEESDVEARKSSPSTTYYTRKLIVLLSSLQFRGLPSPIPPHLGPREGKVFPPHSCRQRPPCGHHWPRRQRIPRCYRSPQRIQQYQERWRVETIRTRAQEK
jgi:protein kinase C substrate 80K-H